MSELIQELLGPYTGLALAFGGLVAWWLRASLRRAHLLSFAVIGALAGASFYMLALLFIVGGNNVSHQSLALFGLYASAAIVTAAASALSLSLLLLSWRKN